MGTEYTLIWTLYLVLFPDCTHTSLTFFLIDSLLYFCQAAGGDTLEDLWSCEGGGSALFTSKGVPPPLAAKVWSQLEDRCVCGTPDFHSPLSKLVSGLKNRLFFLICIAYPCDVVVLYRCAAASEVRSPAFVAPTPVPAFVEPLPVPEEALPNELSTILDEW